jgi:hypothetical protein
MSLVQITTINRGRGNKVTEAYAKKILLNTKRFVNWKTETETGNLGCDFFYKGVSDGGRLQQMSYRTALTKAGVEAVLGEAANAQFIDIPVTGKTEANWPASETHGVTTDQIILGYDNDAGTDSFLWVETEPGKAFKAKSSLTISEIDNLGLAVVPIAFSVTFTGTLQDTEILTGAYTYYDADGAAESGSTFKWYTATDALGTGEAAIGGATSATYTLVTGDVTKYIRFSVVPKNAVDTGVEVKSAYQGPVIA